MIIKHSGFDGSEVMREMERMEAKKNPDAVWKPEPVRKQASSFKSDDPFHNMIMLVAKLRDVGRVEEADRLMTKMAAYQKTAKDVHLYRAIDEDGEDLLEFAYPDGDVDVAPAEGEHGKVHTPQNAHKRIVDIVQKTPTGKYASPTETLLKSVASDLGIEKNAVSTFFAASEDMSYENILKLLKTQAIMLQKEITSDVEFVGDGPYLYIIGKVKERLVTLTNWFAPHGFDENPHWWPFAKKVAPKIKPTPLIRQNMMDGNTKWNSPEFFSMFKTATKQLQVHAKKYKHLIDSIHFYLNQLPEDISSKDTLSKAVSGIQKVVDHISLIRKTSGINHLMALCAGKQGTENFIQLEKSIGVLKTKILKTLKTQNEEIQPKLHTFYSLIKEVSEKMAKKGMSKFHSDHYLVNSVNVILKDLEKQKKLNVNIVNNLIMSVFKKDIDGALNQLESINNSLDSYYHPSVSEFKKLMDSMVWYAEHTGDSSDAIDAKALQSKIRETRGKTYKSLRTHSSFAQYASLTEMFNAVKDIWLPFYKEAYDKKVKDQGEVRDASFKNNLKKQARQPPAAAAAPRATPAQAPAPARSVKTGPATNSGKSIEYEKWLDDVKKWQNAQVTNWWKTVKQMQELLGRLGSTEVLQQIKQKLNVKYPRNNFDPNEFQTVLRSTGYGRYSESYAMDGKWGPATSKSVNAAREILEMFREDASALKAVSLKGYLEYKTEREQEKAKQIASDIISKILKFANKEGITGLTGLGAPTGTTADDNTVFDLVPKDPKLDTTGYEVKPGNIQLTGAHLRDLLPFESWLLNNGVVSESGLVYALTGAEWWKTVFRNLLNRAEAAETAASKKEDQAALSTAKAYRAAVMSLMDRFRTAWYAWVRKNGGPTKNDMLKFRRDKKVSLHELATTLSPGTGAETTGAGKASPATSIQGTSGPDTPDNATNDPYFPLGNQIWPFTWEDKYQGVTRIFTGQLIKGQPLSNYVKQVIDYKDVLYARNIYQADDAILRPAVRTIPFKQKVEMLHKNTDFRLPSGLDIRNVGVKTKVRGIIEEKFLAYVISDVAEALAADVRRVSDSYAQRHSDKRDWVLTIAKYASDWSNQFRKINDIAIREIGRDPASDLVSRTTV